MSPRVENGTLTNLEIASHANLHNLGILISPKYDESYSQQRSLKYKSSIA